MKQRLFCTTCVLLLVLIQTACNVTSTEPNNHIDTPQDITIDWDKASLAEMISEPSNIQVATLWGKVYVPAEEEQSQQLYRLLSEIDLSLFEEYEGGFSGTSDEIYKRDGMRSSSLLIETNGKERVLRLLVDDKDSYLFFAPAMTAGEMVLTERKADLFASRESTLQLRGSSYAIPNIADIINVSKAVLSGHESKNRIDITVIADFGIIFYHAPVLPHGTTYSLPAESGAYIKTILKGTITNTSSAEQAKEEVYNYQFDIGDTTYFFNTNSGAFRRSDDKKVFVLKDRRMDVIHRMTSIPSHLSVLRLDVDFSDYGGIFKIFEDIMVATDEDFTNVLRGHSNGEGDVVTYRFHTSESFFYRNIYVKTPTIYIPSEAVTPDTGTTSIALTSKSTVRIGDEDWFSIASVEVDSGAVIIILELYGDTLPSRLKLDINGETFEGVSLLRSNMTDQARTETFRFVLPSKTESEIFSMLENAFLLVEDVWIAVEATDAIFSSPNESVNIVVVGSATPSTSHAQKNASLYVDFSHYSGAYAIFGEATIATDEAFTNVLPRGRRREGDIIIYDFPISGPAETIYVTTPTIYVPIEIETTIEAMNGSIPLSSQSTAMLADEDWFSIASVEVGEGLVAITIDLYSGTLPRTVKLDINGETFEDRAELLPQWPMWGHVPSSGTFHFRNISKTASEISSMLDNASLLVKDAWIAVEATDVIFYSPNDSLNIVVVDAK